MGLPELMEYFERRKQQCEEELRHTETPGFRIFEVTAQGELDITAQHRERLRKVRDAFQQTIDSLKAEGLDLE